MYIYIYIYIYILESSGRPSGGLDSFWITPSPRHPSRRNISLTAPGNEIGFLALPTKPEID